MNGHSHIKDEDQIESSIDENQHSLWNFENYN